MPQALNHNQKRVKLLIPRGLNPLDERKETTTRPSTKLKKHTVDATLAEKQVFAGVCGSSARAVIESPIEYAKVGLGGVYTSTRFG